MFFFDNMFEFPLSSPNAPVNSYSDHKKAIF